jgi:MFS family permease
VKRGDGPDPAQPSPHDRLAPFRSVWRNRALRQIQTSWAGSYTGDAIIAVAFGVLAYNAGGPKGVALLVAAQMLPAAALAPIVSAATRGVERERLVLAIDSLRALVAAAAAALAAVHVPNGYLVVLAAVSMTAAVVSSPARRALAPLLVQSPAELTAVGVVSSVVQAAALTAGPIIAGVLYLTTDTWSVLAAAALVLAGVVIVELGLPSTSDVAIRPPSARRALGLAEGFRAVRLNAQLKLVAAMFVVKNLARGAVNVLVVVVPLQLLGLEPAAVGWLSAMIGVGGIVGGVAASSLVGRSRMAGPMALGLVFWALPLLVLGLVPTFVVALVGLVVVGGGNTLTDVAGYTLIARSARDDLLTRVLGFHEGMRALSITAGSAITAGLIDLVGTETTLVVLAVAIGVMAGAGALWRKVEVRSSVDHGDLLLLRSHPLFGWLPPMALERVAFTMEQLDLPSGGVLLRQGDPGDRAYIVADGELVVDKDGIEIGRVGPGAVVGEIALLRAAPRMATATAFVPTRLLAIDREEFLAAATGGSAAREAADDLVEERLAVADASVARMQSR